MKALEQRDNIARKLGRLYRVLTNHERRALDYLERHDIMPRAVIPLIGGYLPCFECYTFPRPSSTVPRLRHGDILKRLPFGTHHGMDSLDFQWHDIEKKNRIRCILFEDFRCSSYDKSDFCQSAVILPLSIWYSGFVHGMMVDVLFRLQDDTNVHELEWQWEEALHDEEKTYQWNSSSSRPTLSRFTHLIMKGNLDYISDDAEKKRLAQYKKSWSHYRENVTCQTGDNTRHCFFEDGQSETFQVSPLTK